MRPFEIEDEEKRPLTITSADIEIFVAHIAQILARSQTPCVLWGNYLLTVYRVPSIVQVRP